MRRRLAVSTLQTASLAVRVSYPDGNGQQGKCVGSRGWPVRGSLAGAKFIWIPVGGNGDQDDGSQRQIWSKRRRVGGEGDKT